MPLLQELEPLFEAKSKSVRGLEYQRFLIVKEKK